MNYGKRLEITMSLKARFVSTKNFNSTYVNRTVFTTY